MMMDDGGDPEVTGKPTNQPAQPVRGWRRGQSRKGAPIVTCKFRFAWHENHMRPTPARGCRRARERRRLMIPRTRSPVVRMRKARRWGDGKEQAGVACRGQHYRFASSLP